GPRCGGASSPPRPLVHSVRPRGRRRENPRPHAFTSTPTAGEGGRGSGEGAVHVPNACAKPKGAFPWTVPPHPGLLPSRGEGARRAVEGDCDRFLASIHVRILEAFPPHEPS